MNERELKEGFENLKTKLLSRASLFFDGKKEAALTGEIIKFLSTGCLYSIYAFLLSLSSSLFSTYPLGLSLLCASERKVFFVYIGCIAAAFTMGGDYSLPYLTVYTLIVAMRFLVYKWIYSDTVSTPFCEEFSVRGIIALISGLGIGLYFCVIEKFTLFALGGLVFITGISFALTMILSGRSEKAVSLHRQASYCALGFCLVSALSGYSFLSFSLGFAACTCISVYAAMTGEMFFSTIFSLISGFACRQPALAPMFAIIALAISLARRFTDKASLPFGIIAGAVYSFWAYGSGAVTYVIPDVICGSIIAFFIITMTKKGRKEVKLTDNKIDTDDIQEKKNRAAREDAMNMSLSLASLSSVLNSIAEKLRRPDITSLEEISSHVYSDCCASCKMNSLCSISYNQLKDKDKKSFAVSSSAALFDRGYVQSCDFPDKLNERCKNTKEMVYRLNESYGAMLKSLLNEDRTAAFSSGYLSVSKLIEEGETRREEELSVDNSLSSSAAGLVKEMGLSSNKAYVYGNRKKHIVIRGKGNLPVSGKKLKESFSNLCKTPTTSPYIEHTEDGWQVTMQTIPKISCQMGSSEKSKLGEDICGDHVVCFTSNDGYCYSVLSDGMGSGRQAAMVSGICCTFAEKLSVCGGSLKTVLEAINNYVLNQSYECSATLDLLRIDRYTGEGCFVKSGAVTSLVIRGGHVFRISSATVPIGVMRELNSEQITLPLKTGDIIIMTSDGVNPDLESGLFISDTALKYSSLSANEIAEKIIEAAETKLKRQDDMSCAVIKILKAY